MISEAFMNTYFWGVYIWFVAGFLLIAIPAVPEVVKILFAEKK